MSEVDPTYDLAMLIDDLRRASDYLVERDEDDAQGLASDLNVAITYLRARYEDWRETS